LDGILKLGIPVIEDCAQALGSTYKGKPCGRKGIISIFSLYATKMIAAGEGGVVCTNDKRISENIQDLNNYDMRNSFRVRYNYKMSDLTAGIVLSQLKKLDYFVKRRILIAQQYKKAFSFLPFEFQKALPKASPNYYRFVVCSPLAKKIINITRKYKVMCDRPIYKPLHHYLNTGRGDFQGTDYLWKQAISIPIYPALSNKEILTIIDAVHKSVKKIVR
jgi:dTDP-4-amino-4,6-dideoxygalactose transaminase